MKKLRRLLSMVVAVVILLTSIPLDQLAYAAGNSQGIGGGINTDPFITEIKIQRNYRENYNDLSDISIRISGFNLGSFEDYDRKITVEGQGLRPIPIEPNSVSNTEMYYSLNVDTLGNKISSVNKVIIQGNDYEIVNKGIGKITNVNPRVANLVKEDGDNKVEVIGTDFKDEGKDKIYIRDGNMDPIDSYDLDGNKKITINLDYEKTNPGNYSLSLENKEDRVHKILLGTDDEGNKVYKEYDIDYIVSSEYIDLFQVYKELDVSKDAYIVPNQGPTGTRVSIIGDKLLREMSVFFVESVDGVYNFTKGNMGTNPEYTAKVKIDGEDKDVFKVDVPKGLLQKEYAVVLTNKVDDKDEPKDYITSIVVLKDKFTVLDDKSIATIVDVYPPKGPVSGLDVEIEGKNIGTIHESIFEPNENFNGIEIKGLPSDQIVLEYKSKEKDKSIGKYKIMGNDGTDVIRIEKKIKGVIGNNIRFYEDVKFSSDQDIMKVRIPSIDIKKDEDRFKDVSLQIETTYYIKTEEGEEKVLRRATEYAYWDKKFEFEEIRFIPKITSVVPRKIPVDDEDKIIEKDIEGTNKKETLELNIYGDNFIMYKYGEVGGKRLVKKPYINLGGQAILDPNITRDIIVDNEIPRYAISDEDYRMYNKKGEEISGAEGDDIATRIRVKLPAGIKVSESAINGGPYKLVIENPLKTNTPIDENKPDIGYGGRAETNIEFVRPDTNFPKIISIKPRAMTTDGYKNAVIDGTGFDKDVKVYIDGVLVNKAKRESANRIVLDIPPNKPGTYQVVVQNGSGGIDMTTITFEAASTDIDILEFNPKMGTKGTIVTVKGKGFRKPADENVMDISNSGIYKLLGTRILLGGEDVNEYNLNKDGEINLEDFEYGRDLLQIDIDKVVAKDYYHSLVFVGEDKGKPKYYTMYYSVKDSSYIISDGYLDNYVLSVEKGEIVGKNVDKKYRVESMNGKLKIGDTSLSIKTPFKYRVEDGKIITGNKVRVISDTELIFEVPKKPREGYYDLTVINPDRQRKTLFEEKGFYYSFQPSYNPKIQLITPDKGTVKGGYFIDIIARKDGTMFKGFIDNGGDEKTSVTIGSVKVNPKDIKVSSDGMKLTVKVPPYTEEIPKYASSKSVTVTVVNPDGGSDSRIDGFTYVIATSNPVIKNLFKNTGAAHGGIGVVVEGSDFRYFEQYRDKNGNLHWDQDEEYTDINRNGMYDDLRTGRVWVSKTEQKDIDKLTEEEYEQFVRPILPKVYFGDREATIIGFEDGRIEVKEPAGLGGSVQVYLVNNDYGRSNELTYTYESSNPSITNISPSMGSKEGGQTLEIVGKNFFESEIDVITSEASKERKLMQLVQFGDVGDINISNKTFKIGDLDENGFDNSGKIERRRAKVNVGNLSVDYDGLNKELRFKLSEGTGENLEEFEFIYRGWDEEDIYLPVDLLESNKPDEDGKKSKYKGYGLIKIGLELVEGAHATTRLRVDRGYSASTKLQSRDHIQLELPSYYTVGDTIGRVINSDKQEASKDFVYRNPASNPLITNVLKNGVKGRVEGDLEVIDVPYTGGSLIRIEGTDFRKPTSITLGGVLTIPGKDLKYMPNDASVPSAVYFNMPKVDDKYIGKTMTLALTNPDGGSTISNKHRIRFTKPETVDMEVTAITPNFGPTVGGTVVTIHGNDFRETMDNYPGQKLKVSFARGSEVVEVPEANIISVTFDKIVLTTPAFPAGVTDVIIENPDGNQVRLLGGFTYKSGPSISLVVDPGDENILIDTISVEGGERIKIKGNDFLENPRVIFNPVLKEVKDGDKVTGDVITIGDKVYVLESGIEGKDIEYINKQNLLVTTPPGSLGDKGVIVINTDGGATNIYNLEYGTPSVQSPFGVKAELVYDQFIRVTWTGVRNALEYEIYVSEDGKSFEYVGSTELTSFAYEDIKERREYQFLVRAIGQYGTSKPIEESKSNIVKTGRRVGPEDTDGELGEETVINIQGSNADISIGSKDFGSGGYTIDLTRGKLAGIKDLTIRMPASIVGGYSSGQIRVIGGDYSMVFSPSVFRTGLIEENRRNSNAGVVFKIGPYNQNIGIPGGRIPVGPKYKLEALTYIGKNTTRVDRLAGGINLVLDTNTNLLDTRIESRREKVLGRGSQGYKDLSLSRYYDRNKTWIKTQSVDRMAVYSVTGSRR